MTAYKSKIIRFKMAEDPLQRRINLLTFVESMEIIFWVLLDYRRIGGENIDGFTKKSIRTILHANIYVHSRILTAEFPADGIKCTEKFQSRCANMTFADKNRHDNIFRKSHIKETNPA